MKIKYIAQLCDYTALLIKKHKELLTAFRERWPEAKIIELKKELAGLYRMIREIRANVSGSE